MQITIDVTPRALKAIAAVAVVGTSVAVLAACGSNNPALGHDQGIAADQLATYQGGGQEVHSYKHSQYRATLQDAEDYEAHGVTTTSFDVSYAGTLLFSCPSIGLPVHATDSLTNPNQLTYNSISGNGVSGVLPQMENTGVYPGSSSGTFELCVRPDGSTYINYNEGEVHTIGAPAHWDPEQKQIIVDGNAPADGKPTVIPKN